MRGLIDFSSRQGKKDVMERYRHIIRETRVTVFSLPLNSGCLLCWSVKEGDRKCLTSLPAVKFHIEIICAQVSFLQSGILQAGIKVL